MKKLFSRLFGQAAPPPPPTLPERIGSLQAASADVVVTTALGAADTSLRIGAIRLLPDGDALRALAGLADPVAGSERTPSAVRHAAQERVAQLIDAGSIDFAAFCDTPSHRTESIVIAALCADGDRLRQELVRVDDPQELARLAAAGPTSRVRLAAAGLIEDPALWQALLPQVRGKDKAVYKLLKQRHDARVAEQRKADECTREAAALCESLERHGSKPHDALYAATLQSLSARWRALALRPEPEIEQRGEQALERCRETIAAHERALAQRAAEQEARSARARELEAEQRAAAEQAAADAQAAAAAASDQAAADAAALAATEHAEHDDEHDAAAPGADALEPADAARAEAAAAQAQARREIAGLIRLSAAALQRGDTRKAARFRQGIEEALLATPALPLYLTRNLQQLDDRLNELKQWKDYVVAPKRLELIEDVEALVGSQEEPAALAEHLRALRQEWRTINKGIASDASEDAARFERAYTAAYQPCQAYFAAQAAVRRENLDARKQVLERLKAFEASLDAEHIDHRLVLQVLREAPQELRSHAPVDREASRPVEREFFQCMDRLRTVVNTWYERNESDKRALITQAQHLSTLEDTTAAIDGVKRLQASWRETGPVPRDKSQALWDEFREVCDAVYQRRAQAYQKYSAELEAAKTQALALCEQVEQSCSVTTEERAAARARLHEWQDAFEALGELPRAEARALRDRFERALSRYEAGLAQQDLRDAEAAESKLLEAARHVRAYERAVMAQAPSADLEQLKDATATFMAAVRRWPRGGLQAVKQALARADSVSAADAEARENALRLLCIRCEMRNSMPTPPEDAARRQDYQMRLLVEGMGRGVQKDDRDALLLEWIGIGAIEPGLHEQLERRFVRCLAKQP